MEIRSFLGFELPPDIKTIISKVSRAGKELPLDVRWVKLDNIHLTIIFMGNISEEQIEPIGKAVKQVCARYEGFNVTIEKLGFFGSRRNPRILWMGLGGDVHRMGHFRDALQKKSETLWDQNGKKVFQAAFDPGAIQKRCPALAPFGSHDLGICRPGGSGPPPRGADAF